jgi:hypothetical protein
MERLSWKGFHGKAFMERIAWKGLHGKDEHDKDTITCY